MNKVKAALGYFSKGEIILWSFSVLLIMASFVIFDRGSYLTLSASLIGATSLIFCAKGNPVGQVLIVVFSVIYGVISFRFAYYGEMITYLGMTAPMAVVAFVSWIKNPYNGKKSRVKVNSVTRGEIIFMLFLTAAVTAVFYFILKFFSTANLLVSTFSVATSFAAVYLTFRRSPYFALAYAANDVVLIVLWTLASLTDASYISVTVCFVMFLANDIYGFVNWIKMRDSQRDGGKSLQNKKRRFKRRF